MVCGKTTYASLLLALLLLALVQTALSQNYHFSNGWYPGKKRSSSSSSLSAGTDSGSSRRGTSSYGAFEDPCTLRPETVMLINRILQDEVARMQRSCNSDAPSGLTEILENAASKLESEGKW